MRITADNLIQTIRDIATVGAQKHGATVPAPIMCDDCETEVAVETWDGRPWMNEIDHYCELCADRRRDHWLERHS